VSHIIPENSPDWPELDHAAWAATHLLALTRELDPGFPRTDEMRDAATALVRALAAALASGGTR
jgi:hypothetical protein